MNISKVLSHFRHRRIKASSHSASPLDLTVIVPAYNEEASIADTIRSLQNQTWPAKKIIVVNDCSTDRTGAIARSLNVTVLAPSQNTGSKAGAQNLALNKVKTKYTMAIDADTTLAPDALEKLFPAFLEKNVAAACGSVIPRHKKTLWERGRYIEYLFAFSFYKPIQDYFCKPLISSGCFSAYRTRVLKKMGGWPIRTMAEDMDLTWSFYQAGYGVRFIPEAISYPIEPHNLKFMSKQLRRWSHGFVQNVRLHGREVIDIPYLSFIISVGLWDSIVASLAYLIGVPLIVIFTGNPFFLLAYFIDLPALAVPVLIKAFERREIILALSSLPAFFVLRFVNSLFILEAFWSEIILRRPLLVYEKGH